VFADTRDMVLLEQASALSGIAYREQLQSFFNFWLLL
jgi:hypothetical protein